jgi:conflict system pore-forming effector with SLATT domain
MTAELTDSELPGFFRDADKASVRGQRMTILLNGVRLYGAGAAALGGALSWKLGFFDLWGGVALIGFAAALAAEVTLVIHQPERDWYAGRALAESAKTLAWRYAVAADPFPADQPTKEARRVLRERLVGIAEKGKDRVTLSSDEADVTPRMAELRELPFAERKAAYLKGRVQDQKDWYARNAEKNKRRALFWRVLLIVGEVLAVALASGRAFGVWDLDVSGVLAAAVAGSAAWFGIKQYSALASAYSVTASELSLTRGRILDTDEPEWAAAVADAEGAISREHTLWLASRSGGH